MKGNTVAFAGLIVVLAMIIIARPGAEGSETSKGGTGGEGSTHVFSCQVLADSPQRPAEDDPRDIVGAARFWCEDPGADQLTLTIRLQERSRSGGWNTVAEDSFTLSGADTVQPEDERYRTRTVSIACRAGTFRTVVTGLSSLDGDRDTYDLTGAPSTDPCRTSSVL